jgi:hypothetical protein
MTDKKHEQCKMNGIPMKKRFANIGGVMCKDDGKQIIIKLGRADWYVDKKGKARKGL